MSDFEHLKGPSRPNLNRRSAPPTTVPVVDARGHHLSSRWRAILAALAFVVAALCFVVTWLLVSRAHLTMQTGRTIADLACQVQRLGGQPVDNVNCPPLKKASPTPSSTPTAAPTITLSPGAHTTVLVVPGAGRPVTVTQPAPQPSRTSSTSSRSPTPKPTHSASPSPKPKPSTCAHVDGITSVCLTPPPFAIGIGTVWLWL